LTANVKDETQKAEHVKRLNERSLEDLERDVQLLDAVAPPEPKPEPMPVANWAGAATPPPTVNREMDEQDRASFLPLPSLVFSDK